MSKYSELLRVMIKKSDLTLREIADECRLCGVRIDPSYISKLQTGKQAPPSEEISRVLTDVLGGDSESNLVLCGYLEKAPLEAADFLEEYVAHKHPEPKEKLCPLREELCIRETCAWWNNYDDQPECALLTLALAFMGRRNGRALPVMPIT